MQYTENLHLNLPEDSDPLEVSKLSENFEKLDEVARDVGSGTFKVGDTLSTYRTDLGENWLLCNGDRFDPEQYPELAALMSPVAARVLEPNRSGLTKISTSGTSTRRRGAVGKKYGIMHRGISTGHHLLYVNLDTMEQSYNETRYIQSADQVIVYLPKLESFAYMYGAELCVTHEDNIPKDLDRNTEIINLSPYIPSDSVLQDIEFDDKYICVTYAYTTGVKVIKVNPDLSSVATSITIASEQVKMPEWTKPARILGATVWKGYLMIAAGNTQYFPSSITAIAAGTYQMGSLSYVDLSNSASIITHSVTTTIPEQWKLYIGSNISSAPDVFCKFSDGGLLFMPYIFADVTDSSKRNKYFDPVLLESIEDVKNETLGIDTGKGFSINPNNCTIDRVDGTIFYTASSNAFYNETFYLYVYVLKDIYDVQNKQRLNILDTRRYSLELNEFVFAAVYGTWVYNPETHSLYMFGLKLGTWLCACEISRYSVPTISDSMYHYVKAKEGD